PIKLNPSLPPALNHIIMKAAAKEPKDRYQSAKAMRLDLMRVLREPSGTFARQAQQKPNIKAKRGVFRIALVAVVALGLFGALFLAARTVLERRAISSTELVPKLVGKSIEEAKNIAKLRTYTIDIIETVTSSEFPGGVVLEQEPSAGTALKNGSQISVTVSAGAFMPRVPELFGLTLKEAEEALLDAGLVRGDIEYRISDAPVGTVFKQDPAEGTSLFEGDEVQLFISGEPSRNIEMINVTGLSLRRALPLLKEAGFNALRVKLTEAPEAGQEDLVLKQNPAYGESASNANAVELTVSGKLSGLYTADVAFRVDVDEPLTKLLATIPLTLGAVEYERIVYEALLDEGPEQEVSFTAAIGEGGERQMNVYLNNALTRKTAVTFSHTG
ncbi:MAG TPA: PASTA domain-containing protein, partial [Clostridia bacterium]|nr:PASTA domain-containing protein [Clostridia bacterium]